MNVHEDCIRTDSIATLVEDHLAPRGQMAATKAFNVGIIIGSQRVVRIGPQVANFVLDTIKTSESKASTNSTMRPQITFDTIDIAAQKLPMFDESGIPAQIKSPEDYEHEHTRIWARRIASLDAFVFVSAQRNWGMPAELKNAIDYLFHEWKGNPAMIVTYGGHGGEQCAEQLKKVLGSGIGMSIVDRMVHMSFPSSEFTGAAFKGQELGLDATNDAGPWAEHRSEIVEGWDQVVGGLLGKDVVTGTE